MNPRHINPIDSTRNVQRWRLIAGHEAAHAVAALATTGDVSLMRLWQEADGLYRGGFYQRPPEHAPVDTRSYAEVCDSIRERRKGVPHYDSHWAHQSIVIKLAALAYELGSGEQHAFTHAKFDLEELRQLAEAVTKNEWQRNWMLAVALMQAASIVDHHRVVVDALGDRLAETSHMDGDEIRAVARAAGFPVPIDSRSRPVASPCVTSCLKWCGDALSLDGLRYRSAAIV